MGVIRSDYSRDHRLHGHQRRPENPNVAPQVTYAFNPHQRSPAKGLHPDLARICRRAMAWQLMDFSILETVRSRHAANDNAARGTGHPQ